VALAAGTAGCSSGLTKAGGSAPEKPLILTLAAHDDEAPYLTFAAAVARLSGGSMRIRVAGNWRATDDRREIDFERATVRDVRSGRVALGIVGARVWDTLGDDDFQALVAPLLIDNLALERKALAMPPAAQALARLDRVGVVGIALLPGRLRRPLGLTRRLLGPRDYRDAKVGIRPGAVTEMTLHALGAIPRGYVPGDLTGFDGAELDPLTITQNDYDVGARALTGNVVLWPKPQTIVMNRRAYARLTSGQQRILREAGRQAVGPELVRIARDQQAGLGELCKHGTLRIANASSTDLAALRRAVRPVYARLERDALTKRWIAWIARAREAASPDRISCP
jgi:TRAP-type C4-dicarboxylate transport system substrate-binding protein